MSASGSVIDLVTYRRDRNLPVMTYVPLRDEANARMAFMMTPAPLYFWIIFWAEFASASRHAMHGSDIK